jgi:hypothetical protein
MINPADLIRPGAIWAPGAWTPARCALWREMEGEMRQRLEQWVYAEGRRKRCHRRQLPEIEGRAAA